MTGGPCRDATGFVQPRCTHIVNCPLKRRYIELKKKKNLVKVCPQRLLALLSLTRLSAISQLHKVTVLFVQSYPATLSFSQSCVNCQTLKKKLFSRPAVIHPSLRHCQIKKEIKNCQPHLCPFSNGFRSCLLSKRLIGSSPSSPRHWSPRLPALVSRVSFTSVSSTLGCQIA